MFLLSNVVTRSSCKRVALIVLSAVLLGALSACSSGGEADSLVAPSSESPTQPPPPSEPPTEQPPPSPRTARIMPLGDSITASSTGLPSYRYYLWKLALARGYQIDLVGSRRGVLDGPPLHTDFDMDHEGHGGFEADEILVRLEEWSTQARPDFVLIHLGTNDLCHNQTVQSTVNELGAIIDTLRETNAHVGILLAQIIASAHPCHVRIPELNAGLPALAAAKTLPLSPVVIVDQFTNFDPSVMTYDRFHPNAAGESQMADRWFAALSPLLDAFFSAP